MCVPVIAHLLLPADLCKAYCSYPYQAEKGKIASSFYCHFRTESVTISRLMANHLEGFRHWGWNSCDVTVAVIKDYSPKITDIKKVAFRFQQMSSSVWKVQRCWFIDLFSKISHAIVFNLVKWESVSVQCL